MPSHAYEFIMCGYHDDTPHDHRLGHMHGHGIHFCSQIQAVHQRAKKLLGLSAISRGFEEHYRLDKFDKEHFERFFIETANKDRDRKAWMIYNRD